MTTSYYWCYSCTQFVTVLAVQSTSVSVACPLCDSSFIEEVNDLATTESVTIRRILDRFTSLNHDTVLQIGGDERAEGGIGYRFRDGSDLSQLPENVSESLMELRIRRQLRAIEAFTSRTENPQIPVVKSMPRVKILDCHIAAKADCAVCMECFELETEAREMPCKHIFHEDCITPWLSIKNSCPICRFQLPSEPPRRMSRVRAQERGGHTSRQESSLQGTLESDSNNAGSGLGSGGNVSMMDNCFNDVKHCLIISLFLIIFFLPISLLFIFMTYYEQRGTS